MHFSIVLMCRLHILKFSGFHCKFLNIVNSLVYQLFLCMPIYACRPMHADLCMPIYACRPMLAELWMPIYACRSMHADLCLPIYACRSNFYIYFIVNGVKIDLYVHTTCLCLYLNSVSSRNLYAGPTVPAPHWIKFRIHNFKVCYIILNLINNLNNITG